MGATGISSRKNHLFGKLLMEEGRRLYGDKYALFANPIGNCVVVEFSDDKIALIKRSDKVAEYAGFYDTPGGYAEPTKHGFTSEGHFKAVKDEVNEEIGVPVESIEESHLIGIMKSIENFGKPDMLFRLRTGLPSNKIVTNEEVSGLEILARDQLYENLVEGTYKLVPPSEALMVAYFSLLKGYEVKNFSFLIE